MVDLEVSLEASGGKRSGVGAIFVQGSVCMSAHVTPLFSPDHAWPHDVSQARWPLMGCHFLLQVSKGRERELKVKLKLGG